MKAEETMAGQVWYCTCHGDAEGAREVRQLLDQAQPSIPHRSELLAGVPDLRLVGSSPVPLLGEVVVTVLGRGVARVPPGEEVEKKED